MAPPALIPLAKRPHHKRPAQDQALQPQHITPNKFQIVMEIDRSQHRPDRQETSPDQSLPTSIKWTPMLRQSLRIENRLHRSLRLPLMIVNLAVKIGMLTRH